MLQVMDDLRAAGVDFLTIGNTCSRPPSITGSRASSTPDEFDGYRRTGVGKGFLDGVGVAADRSSYHAGDDFARLRAARSASRVQG